MCGRPTELSRRRFLAAAWGAASAAALGRGLPAAEPPGPDAESAALAADPDKALVAITLDLEMSMHYPRWGDVEWNYRKGDLDEGTAAYSAEVCRRVKARKGKVHCFVLGRTLEGESVDWLAGIIRDGHPAGNHTYDHIDIWATRPEDVQFRFRRAPWLIEGKPVREVIRDNIRLTGKAMKARLGASAAGFRSPGGSPAGLLGREDLQAMLLELGFTWASTMAKSVPVQPRDPGEVDFARVAEAGKDSQPFVYPTGLVEVPMSPIGDVAAFRREKEKWKIGDFAKMLERCLAWTIERRAAFDLLTHPSIMRWEDPEFRAYEAVCDAVARSGGKAAIVGLDTIALRARLRRAGSAPSAPPAPPRRG